MTWQLAEPLPGARKLQKQRWCWAAGRVNNVTQASHQFHETWGRKPVPRELQRLLKMGAHQHRPATSRCEPGQQVEAERSCRRGALEAADHMLLASTLGPHGHQAACG